MGKRQLDTNETASEYTQQMNQTVDTESETKSTYVVLRAGVRVSDVEYDTPTDPSCIQEMKFWKSVADTHSYGEKIEVVLYDSKKHRVW